jgi:hypothetical protein
MKLSEAIRLIESTTGKKVILEDSNDIIMLKDDIDSTKILLKELGKFSREFSYYLSMLNRKKFDEIIEDTAKELDGMKKKLEKWQKKD